MFYFTCNHSLTALIWHFYIYCCEPRNNCYLGHVKSPYGDDDDDDDDNYEL